jgi:hypothetical protein
MIDFTQMLAYTVLNEMNSIDTKICIRSGNWHRIGCGACSPTKKELSASNTSFFFFLKGPCHEIFDLWFFFINQHSTDSCHNICSNFVSNSRIYSRICVDNPLCAELIMLQIINTCKCSANSKQNSKIKNQESGDEGVLIMKKTRGRNLMTRSF